MCDIKKKVCNKNVFGPIYRSFPKHFVLIEEDLALDKTVSNKVWGNVTELRFLFSCSLNERHGLRL